MASSQLHLDKTLGTGQVMVAGVALVVAASTLVSDFAGFFALGSGFAIALVLGFIINVLLGVSAAELAVAYPRSGALYDYARAIFDDRRGAFLGVFLGLSFFGMFAFAASGETAAGAFGLQALLGSDLPVEIFIVVLSGLAVIPNILGIRTTAWVSTALLLLMLGIRWFFGLAGFFGLGNAGPWSAANLNTGASVSLFGAEGIITLGLALAFWSFVGIEFACSLAEEVKSPRKALPRGLLLGLVVIVATSLVMGLGVTGAAPLSAWQAAAGGDIGCGGDCPQLAVGQMMFGGWGYRLMALASVAATLGTLTIAYAAMPRILFSIARDGRFFGPLSKSFGALHPRFKTPVAATIFTFTVYIIPALYSSAVIDWLFSAAYAWILLYVVFHVLALTNRRLHPGADRAFQGGWFEPAVLTGIVLTLCSLYFAFAGAHLAYGGRALIVLLLALGATVVSFRWSSTAPKLPRRAVFRAAPDSSRASASLERHTPATNNVLKSGLTLSRIQLPTGIDMHYAVKSPMDAGLAEGVIIDRAFILLHGYSDSWRSFEEMLELLPIDEFDAPVYALDLRGHGASSYETSPACSQADFAADVVAFMDVLKIERAAIVGHCFGGLIAQRVAISHAERVEKLVLIATAATFAEHPALQEMKPTVDAFADDGPAPTDFILDFQSSAFHSPAEPRVLYRYVAESSRVRGSVWKKALKSMLEEDHRARLPHVEAPALVLWGEQDGFISREQYEELAALIPNATAITYPEAGHALNVERAAEIVRDIERFVGEKEHQAPDAWRPSEGSLPIVTIQR